MAQEVTAGPLSGVRVLELSVAIAGPATAGILSDWSSPAPLPAPPHPSTQTSLHIRGATVTRVEFGKGDPIRNVYGGLHLPGLDPSNPVQMGPGFFVDNRGSETQTPEPGRAA